MAKNTRTGGREATTAVIPGSFALSVGRPASPTEPGYEWRALSDLARLESGHTPSRSKPEYWDGDIPWIGIRDASGNHGRLLADTEQHVSQAGLDNSSARLLPAGTVCLSRTASVGYVVTMGRPMATSQDFVNWVCGPELDNRYLHYLLMAEQSTIRRIAYGSVHPTMYYPDAKALHVCVPSLGKQQAVADVLAALDNKIAVNRHMVGIADELAEAITRRALSGKVVRLADVATVTMGSSPPGSSYNEAAVGLPFYQGVRDFGVRVPTKRIWTDNPVRRAFAGDTLLSVRAPVGRTNLADEEICIGRGLAALRARDGRAMTLFHQVRAAHVAWAPYEAEGTVFGAIARGQLEGIELPAVKSDAASELEARVNDLENVIASALRETSTLGRTRDELLPLLMSGKVRVKDAEKQVEAVL